MIESLSTNPYTLSRSPDRRLFVGAAIGAIVIVFAGFSRTYFLNHLFRGPALPWLLQLHGAVMTSWFVLFFAQTSLISRHRADLHRKLGALGAVLVVVIVVLGTVVTVHAAAREAHAHSQNAPFFLMLLAADPFILIVFAALVGSAIAVRHRRGDVHKRLMLLATLSLTSVALARLPLSFAFFWVAYGLCLFVPVAIDTVRNRRLHPVFGWGAPSLLLSLFLVYLVASTPAWMRFAERLVS